MGTRRSFREMTSVGTEFNYSNQPSFEAVNMSFNSSEPGFPVRSGYRKVNSFDADLLYNMEMSSSTLRTAVQLDNPDTCRFTDEVLEVSRDPDYLEMKELESKNTILETRDQGTMTGRVSRKSKKSKTKTDQSSRKHSRERTSKHLSPGTSFVEKHGEENLITLEDETEFIVESLELQEQEQLRIEEAEKEKEKEKRIGDFFRSYFCLYTLSRFLISLSL